jgi:hypothetical protein
MVPRMMQGKGANIIPFPSRDEPRPVMKLKKDYRIRGRKIRVVMYWYIMGTCPYSGSHYDPHTGLEMCQWIITNRSTGEGVFPLASPPCRRDDHPRLSALSRPRHRGA